MSVQMNTYVLRGAMLPCDLFRGDEGHAKLEPYMDSAFEGINHYEGLCVLYDGMSSKYVAIGQVLAKSENGQGFDRPVAIPPDDLHLCELMRPAIERLAGIPVVIGTFVISHYR